MSENNILQFDISMNDRFRVHILNSGDDLSHDHRCGFLWKWTIFLKKLVKLPIRSKLLEQIHILLITEKIIESNQIWMGEIW